MRNGREWAWLLAAGLVIGIAVFAGCLAFGARAVPAVAAGVFAGLVYGFGGMRSSRLRLAAAARAHQALGFELTRAVRREALRGPVAVDPQTRRRQLAVVHYLLGRVRSTQPRSTVILVGAGLLQAVQAALRSGWFWLGAVYFLGLAILSPLTVLRLRRRRALLASSA